MENAQHLIPVKNVIMDFICSETTASELALVDILMVCKMENAYNVLEAVKLVLDLTNTNA